MNEPRAVRNVRILFDLVGKAKRNPLFMVSIGTVSVTNACMLASCVTLSYFSNYPVV